MKDEKPENRDIISEVEKSDNREERLCLRVHNRSLLTQIKKLKSDKKSLYNELDQLINKKSLFDKETMTEPIELKNYSDVNIPIINKGIHTDLVNLTTQKDANPTNVKRSSNVEVQTSQGYEEDSIPKVNQEKATSIRSKDQVAKMSYDILITKVDTSTN
jgi:hypothetical protein